MFLIPPGKEEQADFFGILGSHKAFTPLKANEHAYLIYNFSIAKAFVYEDQILLTGTPAGKGVEIITTGHGGILDNQLYTVRLATPNDQELDYAILFPSF